MEFFASLWNLLASPLGPPLVLVLGSITVWGAGRWLRRPGWQSGMALTFWLIAFVQTIGLRIQPVVPISSYPWQPFMSAGTHLLWVGDGWNWYVSSLILLLGGVAILLSGFGGQYVERPSPREERRVTITLASHLGIVATALLFVGSGNLLTVTLTWVIMDFFVLARNALAPPALDEDAFVPLDSGQPPQRTRRSPSLNRAQGLSLLGALLLWIGLLPAGPTGPGQPLLGGKLPEETIVLMLVAAAVRAGAYPFHLWLLPDNALRLRLPDRFVDHFVPALCGLWLLGWSSGLGGESLLVRPDFVALVMLALLGSAVAAYTATEKPGHTTFVLITSVGIAGLASILAETEGPSAVIWPTTTFALGGGLWLVGERIWREWGWQVPVSVGALALVGVPFTPGFLTQSAVARLLTGDFSGSLVMPLFVVYLMAQTIYVAALLRSWGVAERGAVGLAASVVWRLLAAGVVLALPLAIAGIFPRLVAAMASVPDAIPHGAGNPPSAVAGWPVWFTLATPLLLGMGLAIVRPRFWLLWGRWPDQVSRFAALDWVSRITEWGAGQTSALWDAGLEIVEGAGYVGWLVAFAVVGYFLLNM